MPPGHISVSQDNYLEAVADIQRKLGPDAAHALLDAMEGLMEPKGEAVERRIDGTSLVIRSRIKMTQESGINGRAHENAAAGSHKPPAEAIVNGNGVHLAATHSQETARTTPFDTRAALKQLRGKMSQEEAAMRMRLNREEVNQDWVCRAEKSMALVRWDALEKYVRLLGGDDDLVAKFKTEHDKFPHMPKKQKNGVLHVQPLPA